MKREGRIHKGVSIGAYSILIAFMLLLLWTVLRYPGNHLIPWQMALGVAAATVLLLAAGAAWNKIYTVTGRRNSLYAVALVLFGVLLYVVSLSRQGNENTLLDYTYVYRDALNLANGRELKDTNYFLTYSNNLKPMPFAFRSVSDGLADGCVPFYFVLLRNVILVMLVACAWLSCGTEWGYLLEISNPACLCISASDVGDDCRVLYGFHELRYGNPGTGFPEIGGSIQGEAPADPVGAACGRYGSTGRHMEDHSDHTADRMRCDPLVAESVGGPSSDIAVWRFCRDSGSGSAALGQFLRDHKGSI